MLGGVSVVVATQIKLIQPTCTAANRRHRLAIWLWSYPDILPTAFITCHNIYSLRYPGIIVTPAVDLWHIRLRRTNTIAYLGRARTVLFNQEQGA